MKRLVLISVIATLTLASCYSTRHHFGDQTGAVQREEQEKSVWLLWGIINVKNADTGEMAVKYGAENYVLIDQYDFIDYVITGITGGIVGTRTYKMQILK